MASPLEYSYYEYSRDEIENNVVVFEPADTVFSTTSFLPYRPLALRPSYSNAFAIIGEEVWYKVEGEYFIDVSENPEHNIDIPELVKIIRLQ